MANPYLWVERDLLIEVLCSKRLCKEDKEQTLRELRRIEEQIGCEPFNYQHT